MPLLMHIDEGSKELTKQMPREKIPKTRQMEVV